MDAVVSDIPFGAKHGTVDGVRHLLPKLIPSLDRYVNTCIGATVSCTGWSKKMNIQFYF